MELSSIRLITHFYPKRRKYGITIKELYILYSIHKKSGCRSPVIIKQAQRFIYQDVTAVYQIFYVLKKKGWIRIEKINANVNTLHITQQGKELLYQIERDLRIGRFTD